MPAHAKTSLAECSPQTLEAENYDSSSGTVATESGSGTSRVILQSDGSEICWNVNIEGCTGATVWYSNGETSGDTLQFYWNGNPLGNSMTVQNCTSPSPWTGLCGQLTASFPPVSGSGTLCLRGTGGGWIAAIDRVEIGAT